MLKRSHLVAAFAVLLVAVGAPGAHAATGALPVGEDGEFTLAPLVREVAPAVVNIAGTGPERGQRSPGPFFEPFERFLPPSDPGMSSSIGSGIIVDAENGYVLTNHHVIDGADRITVTLADRRRVPAELVGADAETDVAVLRIEADGLTAIPYGSSERLEVGDFVLAVGNPFGLGQTFTLGIVSATGRSNLGIEGYEDFIQTDASINPGNSGGPLVDLQGRVIGISTAILGRRGNIGIGFAIPIDMARAVMDQIVEHGSVERGLLGVNIQDLTPDLAAALGIESNAGALVSKVQPGSAAERAGIEEGDVIIGINGGAVEDASDLRNAVGLLRVGETANLALVRGNEFIALDAVVATRPGVAAASGATVAPMTGGAEYAGARFGPIAPDAPLAGEVEGVQVIEVAPNSKAWIEGLRPGDIVTEVNRDPVASPEQFMRALDAAGDKRNVLFRIRRGDGAFYAVI